MVKWVFIYFLTLNGPKRVICELIIFGLKPLKMAQSSVLNIFLTFSKESLWKILCFQNFLLRPLLSPVFASHNTFGTEIKLAHQPQIEEIFIFSWWNQLKILNKNIKNFFEPETFDRYQTMANFMFYHKVKFQVIRICTFSAINDTNFHFYLVKSHFQFWGMAKNDLYTLGPPNLVKNSA